MKDPSVVIVPCFREHVDDRILCLRSAPCLDSESLFKDLRPGGFGFGGQRACPQDPRSPPSRERSDSRSGPWCKADLCSFLAAQVLRIMGAAAAIAGTALRVEDRLRVQNQS